LEPADPVAIAAKVSQLEHDKRLARAVADVERWREIVLSVASGKEPDGQQLADIGAICVRLKLPPDALAIHVAAFLQHGQHSIELDRSRKAMQDTRGRRDELFAQVKRLEKELLDTRMEIDAYHANAGGIPGLMGAKNDIEAKHPVIFGDVQHIATSLVAANVGKPPTVSATTTGWEG
jgi:hypothetical protein